jgi:hypothetical protein
MVRAHGDTSQRSAPPSSRGRFPRLCAIAQRVPKTEAVVALWAHALGFTKTAQEPDLTCKLLEQANLRCVKCGATP